MFINSIIDSKIIKGFLTKGDFGYIPAAFVQVVGDAVEPISEAINSYDQFDEPDIEEKIEITTITAQESIPEPRIVRISILKYQNLSTNKLFLSRRFPMQIIW